MFGQSADRSWIPSSASRVLDFAEEERAVLETLDCLYGVPVMSATVLGLEMVLQEPCIDLRKATDLILSDVGATIQILRLIGCEYGFALERPSRMYDCIASLDACIWFGAMCAHTFTCDRKHLALTAVWKHCRLVAQYAQLVAESMEGIDPEDAYLVGLLHEIGAISAMLDEPENCSRYSPLFAIEGTLPPFVLAGMSGASDSCPSSTWKSILTAAHELAGGRMACDPCAL